MALLCVSESWIVVATTSKLFIFERKGKDVETTAHKIIDVTDVSSTLPFVRTTYELENNVRTNQDEKIEMCCATISRDERFLGVAISSKICLIYSLAPSPSSIQLHRAFRVPKAPSVITFDIPGTHLVVGDRAGNVTMYGVKETIFSEDKLDINGEKTNFEGIPLTGGITMILDVTFDENGKRMITADRDEKIRINRYPKSYVIEAYALGHEEYVKSVAVHKNYIISGGGDCRIHVHDIKSGDSVAISERLHDEKPISRLQVVENEGKLEIWCSFDDEDCLHSVTFDQNDFKMGERYKSDAPVMGFFVDTITGQKFVLNRNGLHVHRDDAHYDTIAVDSSMVERIQAAKNPDITYFKNVTHQNVDDYKKRKATKFAELEAKRGKRQQTSETIVN